jgi:hypothetical protein
MSRTPQWRLAIVAIVAICVLLPPGAALATTFFVDAATGNDGNNGLTEGTAWATLQRALTALVAGDTVLVKNGTYNSGTVGFNTTNSGTAAAPIAIRAFGSGPTRHRPILTRTLTNYNNCFHNPSVQCENDPVIHISGRNHIIWDGFTLASFTSVRTDNVCRTVACAPGSVGAILENLTIDKGPAEPHANQVQFGNYDGIFLNFSSNIIIRNNVIRNVFYLVDGVLNSHQNAAGIVLFDTENVRIHNNRISACNTGIFDKRNSVNNVHELNHITDSNSKGFLLTAFTATQCGGCPVTGLRVRQNIITNTVQAINFNITSGSPGQTIDDLRVHNNVFFNVGQGFRAFGNVPNLRVYNNVIHLNAAAAVSPIAHYAYSADPNTVFPPTPGFVSNFSNFSATSGFQDRFRPDEFGSEVRIAGWRALSTSPDLNSLVGDAALVGPLTGSPQPTAFRLQPGSPLRLAGREDGVSGGAAVNIGAFITDAEVIGPPVDLVAPGPPLNPRIP